LPGSQHDAAAWEETHVPQQCDVLLEDDEWVWADSAYPLQKWCQSPYKKYAFNLKHILHLLTTSVRPVKLIPDNKTYNYHVSAVCIHSEHCIGFLKG
jgi:hypothetical protein